MPKHGRPETSQEKQKRSALSYERNMEESIGYDQIMEPSFLENIVWIDVEDDEEILFPEASNDTGQTQCAKAVPVPVKPKRKRLGIFLMCGVLLIMIVLLFQDATGSGSNQQDTDPSFDPMPEKLKKLWAASHSINGDYIGQIIFDSGLADLAIVQADDVYQEDGTMYEFYTQNGLRVKDPTEYCGNDVYIWSDWRTHRYDGYAEDGAVFLDYRNSPDDQNLILYGHHIARDFDEKGDKEFTPLDVFLNEENYESNKSLKLVLNHEIREYEVARVFTIDVYDEKEIQVVRTDFDHDLSGNDDPGFLENYLSLIDTLEAYPIDTKLSDDDRFLTLITCIQHQPQYRQVVLCKETKTKKYDG